MLVYFPKEIFLSGGELSLTSVILANSRNLIIHYSINWTQFEYPVSHIYLAGTVVASLSPTQEVAGSSHFNEEYFLGKSPLCPLTLYKFN